MTAHDVRWIQRFNHFNKALLQLKKAAQIASAIRASYFSEFDALHLKLESMKKEADS